MPKEIEASPAAVERFLTAQIVPSEPQASHPRCILKTRELSLIRVERGGLNLYGFHGFDTVMSHWPLDRVRLDLRVGILGLDFYDLRVFQPLIRANCQSEEDLLTRFAAEANLILAAKALTPAA